MEDALTVDAVCVWASAVFEVMRDAAGGSEGSFTKGARDIGAAMGAGVEVLGGVLSARMMYQKEREQREKRRDTMRRLLPLLNIRLQGAQ